MLEMKCDTRKVNGDEKNDDGMTKGSIYILQGIVREKMIAVLKNETKKKKRRILKIFEYSTKRLDKIVTWSPNRTPAKQQGMHFRFIYKGCCQIHSTGWACSISFLGIVENKMRWVLENISDIIRKVPKEAIWRNFERNVLKNRCIQSSEMSNGFSENAKGDGRLSMAVDEENDNGEVQNEIFNNNNGAQENESNVYSLDQLTIESTNSISSGRIEN